MPFQTLPVTIARLAGILLVVASVALMIWAIATLRSSGTNVLPSNPALAIVTRGPFRWTRNPMYLSFAGIYVGISLLLNALAPLLLLVPLLTVVEWGVIRREERYLAAKFGASYLAYKAQVRRWL